MDLSLVFMPLDILVTEQGHLRQVGPHLPLPNV
jgi:hypothetical protein